MKRKQPNKVLIALIVIIVVASGVFLVTQSTISDDFGSYTGFNPENILTTVGNNAYWTVLDSCSAEGLGNGFPCPASLKYYSGTWTIANGEVKTRNLLGQHIKISVKANIERFMWSGNPLQGKVALYLNSDKIYEDTPFFSFDSGTKDITFSAELIPSVITPGLYDIYVNGQKQGQKTLTELYITIKALPKKAESYGQFSNDQVKLLLNEDSIRLRTPFVSCSQEGNRLLGFESFTSGQKISLTSFRYRPLQFCSNHPVIITDENQKGSEATSEPYSIIGAGGEITVPAGQTYSLFYTFYNDGSLITTCAPSELNVRTNTCEDVVGLVYLCSTGIFDATIGACVVTPDINYVCDKGRYDVQQGKCIYNPPIQAECSIGNYDSVHNLCVFEPETGVSCSQGTYDSALQKCVIQPSVVYQPDATICLGTLSKDSMGRWSCIIEPKVEIKCVKGAYDATSDKCIYTPQIQENKNIFTLITGILIIASIFVAVLYYMRRR